MLTEEQIRKIKDLAWYVANDCMEHNEPNTGLSYTGVAQACEQILEEKDWGLLG